MSKSSLSYLKYNSSDISNYNFTYALINCEKYSKISRYGERLPKKELLDYFLKRCKYLDGRYNHVEILKVCEEIFKIDKDNEIALQYKIHSLAVLENDEEVLKCLDYAIKLYPNNCIFFFNKAETLLWAFEDVDGAIEYYEKGFRLVEDFDKYCFDIDKMVTALNEKANQLIEEDNYEKAVNIYDKILFYKPKEFKALDNIDALVKNHNVSYEPSRYYKESIILRMELENKFNQIEEYLNTIDIGKYDDEYINGCSEFKDYNSLADYIRDIIICLMDVYPSYDVISSKYLIKIAFDNVKQSFEHNESAYDFAVFNGFSGG